jgi:hypothetical protein
MFEGQKNSYFVAVSSSDASCASDKYILEQSIGIELEEGKKKYLEVQDDVVLDTTFSLGVSPKPSSSYHCGLGYCNVISLCVCYVTG